MAIVTSKFPASVWSGLTSKNEMRPDRYASQSPNPADWDQIVAEVIATQTFVIDINAGDHLDLTQQAAVAGPAGGATVDAEARAVIDELITFLKNTGLMAAS